MIGRFFAGDRKAQSARFATLLLGATLTFSNVLGVVRDHFLAQKIPTGVLDTYYAAFRIPDLLFNLLILGAITSAFIPVFVREREQSSDSRRAWEIAQILTTVMVVVTVIITLVLLVLLPWIVPLVVPKFDPERQQLVLQLTRIMLISPILFGFSYIFGGILNAYKRFVAYSIAPLFYNLAIIIATIAFADRFGVFAIAWGVIAGAALHMLIQLIPTLQLGFRWRFHFSLKDKAIRSIGILMMPRVVALGTQQLALLAFTVIGSALSAGSIAIYNLTNNIQTTPVVIFGTSFATANFTQMAEMAAQKKDQDLGGLLERLTRIILFLLIPASAGLYILRAQVVRLILGSGHFEWEQTILAIGTLAWFIPGIIAQGLIPIYARAFYALHNTKTPTIIAITSFAVMILVALVGVNLGFDVPVLSLSYSVGSIINLIWLLLALRGRLQSISLGRIIGSALRVGVFSVVMASVMWLALRLANGTGLTLLNYNVTGAGLNTHTGLGLLLQALVATVFGLSVFYLLIRVFKQQEWEWLIAKKNSTKI